MTTKAVRAGRKVKMERESNVRAHAPTLTKPDRKTTTRRWHSKEEGEGPQNSVVDKMRDEQIVRGGHVDLTLD